MALNLTDDVKRISGAPDREQIGSGQSDLQCWMIGKEALV